MENLRLRAAAVSPQCPVIDTSPPAVTNTYHTTRAQLLTDHMQFRPVAGLPASHPLQPYLRIHLHPNHNYQRQLCNLQQIKVLVKAAAGDTALRLLQHFSVDISIVFTKHNVECATVYRSNRGSKRTWSHSDALTSTVSLSASQTRS